AAGPDDGFLVGAPFSSINKTNAGAAFFFGSDGNLIAQFGSTLDANGDRFGAAVLAIDTNRILVGAPGANVGATDAGRIYEFTRDGVIMRVIPSPSPRSGGGFGSSLALIGNGMIAVGEPGTNNQGVVHLLRSDLTYDRTLSFNPSGANPRFGSSVAALGPGMIAVGAPCTEVNLFSCQGSIFIFDAAGETFMSVFDLNVSSSAQYGTALLALDSRTLIIGAPFDTVAGQPQSGSLAILRTDTYMEGLFAEGVRNHAIGIDQLNTAAVDNRYVNRAGDTMTGTLHISAPGRLAVGTASPVSELHVEGGIHASGTARDFSVPPPESMQFGHWDGSTFTERARISTSGFFGLGSTAPNALLHVRAPADVDPLRIQADGVTRMRMHNDGSVAIGGNVAQPLAALHVAGGIHATGSSRDFSVPPGEAIQFGHWDGSTFTERVRFNSIGNVGIGNNNPQARLHLGGTPGTDGIMFPDGSLQTRAVSMIRTSVVVNLPQMQQSPFLFRMVIPLPGAQLGMGVLVNRDNLSGANFISDLSIIGNTYVSAPDEIEVWFYSFSGLQSPKTSTLHITLFP
ncbi:MAG TPA: hypothetical protein PKE55_15070, partial [Kiritimatiellia bacterium]|nr:hypothetical protein [Kiritimatiellia bacterium]